MNSLTEADILRVIDLHNKGLLNKEIAELFHVSNSTIARVIQKSGLPSRHPRLTSERKNKIKQCYEEYQNIDKVCEIMNCGSDTVRSIIKEFNLCMPTVSEIRRKYHVEDDYFNLIDTEVKAYALGLYFSDGSVSKLSNQFTISLQKDDKEILDRLNAEFGGNRKLTLVEYSKKNSNWQDQYSFSITNPKMHDDLIRHGVVPNKSLTLSFPDTVPLDLIRHFIRGYFDGDGYLSKTEDRCSIVSTENFCLSVSKIIKDRLNINSSIMFCHDKEKSTRVLQIAGKNQVRSFLNWIYDCSTIFLKRKYELYISKYCSNVA